MNAYGFNNDVMHFRYPKDAEKHLLAIKSGLTRSQVCYYHISNYARQFPISN